MQPEQNNPERLRRLYKQIALIRQVELKIAELYPSDVIRSPVHLAIGQEYIAAAVIDHLREDDYVAATYRGHGVYLAKGGDLNAFFAELFGKKDGCAKGRGGSMHIIESSKNVIGTSAVVASGIPTAVGYALAVKQQKTDQIVVVFFGDGATEEGCFSESINFAALHKLPVLFVCENNRLAIHEPLEKRWAADTLTERVATYNIPAVRITSADVIAISDYARDAVAAVRRGEGPQFLECLTHRWFEHVGPNTDYDQGYRSAEEGKRWRDVDVYTSLGSLISADEKARIDEEIENKIDTAVAFAEANPFPGAEELFDHVYA
ncbi:MAG: thiamine pyrophosphate-dependent dehydrogenase E1 component subunit alpha [Pseudomonadota bacterium]|nr:thiamine pyrophosphate-dependent dehydrogenase E1 component subunit alpha [Pseudomonadota bacterium]